MTAIATSPRRIPVVPDHIPILGSRAFLDSKHGLPAEQLLQWATDYPQLYQLTIKGQPIYVVTDPALVHEILTQRPDDFVKANIGKMQNRGLSAFLGEGILFLPTERWQQPHSIIQPLMHPNNVGDYLPPINRLTEQWLNQIAQRPLRLIDPDMSDLALEIVLKTMFGIEGNTYPGIHEAVAVLRTIGNNDLSLFPLPDWVPTPRNRRVNRTRAFFRQLIRHILHDHAETADPDTLLGQIVRAKDERGQPVSEDFIYSNLLTMLVAGHDTTASLLTWAIYYLGLPEQRDALNVLQIEVDHTLSRDIPIQLEDLKALPLVRAALNETLRIEPPV